MGDFHGELLFEHFVVLMLENRSFDHLFGFLGIGDGLRTARDQLFEARRQEQRDVFVAQGQRLHRHRARPSHSLKETNLQLFGVTKPTRAVAAKTPALNGFVASFKAVLPHDSIARPRQANCSR
jgi:phospholipase C